MNIARDELFAWIDQTLEVSKFHDYSPIGLQVEGRDRVAKVALGVSAHMALIEAAATWGADVLLVHHGFFWNGEPRTLVGHRKARIAALFSAEMSLGGYHLPLDGHPTLGNNAQLADLLGLDVPGRYAFGKSGEVPIGLVVRLPEAITREAMHARIVAKLGEQALFFEYGPKSIDTVAVVSGGAASYFSDARQHGAQLYLTGEASEQTMAEAMETETTFVAAGHYNTERLGIMALGNAIEAHFALETRFFEFPNPV